MEDLLDHPHVQYLSQQFVDQLCSTERLDNALVKEIERVIFNAHSIANRMGAGDFEELLNTRLETVRQKRERQRGALAAASSALTDERARKEGLKALEKDRDEKQRIIEKDKKDKASLVGKDNAESAKRHEEISEAVEAKRRKIEQVNRHLQALHHLQNDVQDYRDRQAPALLMEWKEFRRDTNLTETDWENFKVDFVGSVDLLLRERVEQAKLEIKRLEGAPPAIPTKEVAIDQTLPLILSGANLADQAMNILEREQARLGELVAADLQKAKRYSALSEKIAKADTALKKVLGQIERANEADEKMRALREHRRAAYEGIFNAIVEEEGALVSLYAPLKHRIETGTGSLSKLSFSVRRVVDLESWAETGEHLLDLRTNGPFKGRGALLTKARSELLLAWSSGDAAGAAESMFNFVKSNESALRAHMPEGADFRAWATNVSNWLYGTNHIRVGYGLKYDGIDIERLSPGTRGIVLLLIYLAIDAEDDRPLIIDQPEENLDPQSVFNELVSCFREAKKRRQIIIVTHNANLVVNTDADQVIVATCSSHQAGQLPVITYESGGLENSRIRGHVCNILEGGERAFKERAKRLRVSLH